MPQCVVADPSTGVLSTSASDPCTGYVLLTPTEYSVVSQSAFTLSSDDGAAVGAAICGVWFVAWGTKALLRTLRGSDEAAID